MKTLRFIGMAIIAVIMGVNFAACSSDDDDDNDGGNTISKGAPVVSITRTGYVPEEMNWIFAYSNDKLTSAQGQLIYFGQSDEKENYGISYQGGIQLTGDGADEISKIETNKNGYITFIKTTDDAEISYEYTADGYLKSVTEVGTDKGRDYVHKTIITYTNGCYDKIVVTDSDGETTYTFTATTDENKNGVLPELISESLGCFGHEFIYYAGLLGKPVQKLVNSMSESNNSNTKSYNFSYSFDELGNVVLCQYLYDNKNVTVKYGY